MQVRTANIVGTFAVASDIIGHLIGYRPYDCWLDSGYTTMLINESLRTHHARTFIS